jgi:hypothetical protein
MNTVPVSNAGVLISICAAALVGAATQLYKYSHETIKHSLFRQTICVDCLTPTIGGIIEMDKKHFLSIYYRRLPLARASYILSPIILLLVLSFCIYKTYSSTVNGEIPKEVFAEMFIALIIGLAVAMFMVLLLTRILIFIEDVNKTK